MISNVQYAAMARWLSAIVLVSLLTTPARAAESAEAGGWDLSLEPYLWMPVIEIGTPAANIQIDFSDILESLNWVTMISGTAKKGKLTVFGDVINLKLTQSGSEAFSVPVDPAGPFGPFNVNVNVDGKVVIKTWIVTGGIDYELVRTDKYALGGVVGARSLWLDTVTTETATLRKRSGSAKQGGSGWFVDGIAGMQGRYAFDDKTFLRWYGDVGTGDSNLTWAAQGEVVYQFKRFEAFVGYRYMTWDLDDAALTDLEVSGPRVGANFRF